jgi:predicted transcriptional regulator
MCPYKITLKKIMSSPVITIDEESAVADAISLMISKHIRRLPLKKKITQGSNKNITRIVTLMSIAGLCPKCQNI